MKRITLSLLFACGLVATTVSPAFAQTPTPTPSPTPVVTQPSWFMGGISVGLLGRDDVASSKFEEYRTVPKGFSVPNFSLAGSQNNIDFSLYGKKVGLDDQRYTGMARTSWLGFTFDYNQILHNMGNDGHTMWAETAPGVWSMSSTLRNTLGTTIEGTASSGRTYPFYLNLFTPTMNSAGLVDLTSHRDRGTYEFDLGQKLPFDLVATYMHEAKTGYRGAGGGRLDGVLTNILEVPWALNEVTQDVGFRAALNKTWGNVYGAYAHNWYNNLVETSTVDNPIRATDLVYNSSTSPNGGAAKAFFVGPPDNSADNGSFGVMLKFARQTRITADAAFGQWNQNAQLYPYTLNSTILTGAGLPANLTSSLDVQSANGKIDTTMYNFGFVSRPFRDLTVRARYRSYDMNNKTVTFLHTGTAGSNPDRQWTAASAPSEDAPFGFATANPYSQKTARFDLQGSYDITNLTFEGTYFNNQIDRTYREALSNTDNGWTVAAILHQNHWLLFRGSYGQAKRTAPPDTIDPALFTGYEADIADRNTTRSGLEVDFTPGGGQFTFMVAYFHHNDDYPNRPNRTAGVDGTTNGLLKANYDTYTLEADWNPVARFSLGGYYTYEKDLSTTQTGGTTTTGAGPLASVLTFDGSDRGDTYGANARFAITPDKWTFNFDTRRQKIDGLMAITGDPAGAFALARVAYGGIQNIADYNDTDLTTVNAGLDYAITKAVVLNFGYVYEKYKFADAYSTPTAEMMPATGGFYLKANDNGYKVNVVYLKMNYRW
jgi:hypothetical protein